MAFGLHHSTGGLLTKNILCHLIFKYDFWNVASCNAVHVGTAGLQSDS